MQPSISQDDTSSSAKLLIERSSAFASNGDDHDHPWPDWAESEEYERNWHRVELGCTATPTTSSNT